MTGEVVYSCQLIDENWVLPTNSTVMQSSADIGSFKSARSVCPYHAQALATVALVNEITVVDRPLPMHLNGVLKLYTAFSPM